eukprot:scaffold29337_cov26-Tisochrysis_lutea.AAC.3
MLKSGTLGAQHVRRGGGMASPPRATHRRLGGSGGASEGRGTVAHNAGVVVTWVAWTFQSVSARAPRIAS